MRKNQVYSLEEIINVVDEHEILTSQLNPEESFILAYQDGVRYYFIWFDSDCDAVYNQTVDYYRLVYIIE